MAGQASSFVHTHLHRELRLVLRVRNSRRLCPCILINVLYYDYFSKNVCPNGRALPSPIRARARGIGGNKIVGGIKRKTRKNPKAECGISLVECSLLEDKGKSE